MPKREDEHWAGRKQNLRYCAKHARYYRPDVGCQFCGYDKVLPRQEGEDGQRLDRCPKCERASLFWDTKYGLYECLNPKCRKRFAKGEVAQRRESASTPGKCDEEKQGEKCDLGLRVGAADSASISSEVANYSADWFPAP